MVLGMRVRAHEGAEGKASQGPDAAPAVDPYAEARKAVRAASQGFPGHDSGRTMGSGALAYRRPTTSAGSSLPGVSVPDDGPDAGDTAPAATHVSKAPTAAMPAVDSADTQSASSTPVPPAMRIAPSACANVRNTRSRVAIQNNLFHMGQGQESRQCPTDFQYQANKRS